jgi:DNA-binding response OmpR family regulator
MEDAKLGIQMMEPGKDKPLLLLVDDNRDLRQYVIGFLKESYQVLESSDGKKGLEIATERVPDLIISDVMMPEMDGYEFCAKLKTDERTSHIPVIMLTARADMDSKLTGLDTGADDFITKPFDSLELLTRIKNLIWQRKKLQQKFNKNIQKLGIGQVLNMDIHEFKSADQSFMQKVVNTIYDHLSDPDYSIESLAGKLSMSRRQLHRKLVSITGHPPVIFIRIIRLNRAAELLLGKSGNVTEIAYEVGFNNLSWFAKAFKEHFGVLPSEYKG